MHETIRIATTGGSFSAFVARPAASVAPTIVVLHEVFGVNADMRATCQELADQGYIAVCPDLFWRQEPGLSLSRWSDAEWKKGLALYAAFDFDIGLSDIMAAATAARSLSGASGKVGVMGFGLGGLMTFLTVARGGADAGIVYCGSDAENHLDDADAVGVSMLMHQGEDDEFISKEAQQKIKVAFADNRHVTIYSYPGCRHAFARNTGTRYDVAAAATASARTADFFAQQLR